MSRKRKNMLDVSKRRNSNDFIYSTVYENIYKKSYRIVALKRVRNLRHSRIVFTKIGADCLVFQLFRERSKYVIKRIMRTSPKGPRKVIISRRSKFRIFPPITHQLQLKRNSERRRSLHASKL